MLGAPHENHLPRWYSRTKVIRGFCFVKVECSFAREGIKQTLTALSPLKLEFQQRHSFKIANTALAKQITEEHIMSLALNSRPQVSLLCTYLLPAHEHLMSEYDAIFLEVF